MESVNGSRMPLYQDAWWDGLWMEARKEKLETPIRLCSFNTLWGCDVARAFTSNTFAVVFSWGKTWDFSSFFFFLSTESRIESSNVDSWNPFSKNAIRISNFCISELLLVLLKSFSHSFSLVRMFRVKRKMFYEIGIFFRQDIIGTLRVSSNLQFLSYFSFLHW